MKKHALVLSGGGARGAYEAAAAKRIIEHYSGTNLDIRLIAGTSVGALNAAGIASGGPGFPVSLWKTVTKSDVMRDSRTRAAWRILRDKPVYDSRPLWKLITKNIDIPDLRSSKYKILIHSTNLDRRTPVIASNDSDYILESVYASAAIPGAFPPVRIKGYTFVDGGVVTNTPLGSVIELGCNNITIILLDDEPLHPREYLDSLPDTERDVKFDSLRAIMSRTAEASIVAQFRRDITLLKVVNEQVEANAAPNGKRKINFQIFKPPAPINETLDFDRRILDQMLIRGQLECERWLAEEAW